MNPHDTPAAEPLAHPKYRRDIDGLRAIAVVSVLGFHAFPQWIKGGFVGVDIFFVISGFLIGTIILGSLQGSGFSYREFYARRITRIFPALLLVLAASLGFGWYALLPGEWQQLGKHVAAGAGFVSNFAFWSEAGYFDNAGETKPLLHLWSLAIEEQFYIVWPLVLGLAWRRKWPMLAVIGGLAFASFLLGVGTVHGHRTAAFYSPLPRFWELMLGGVLAYLRLHRPERLSRGREAQALLGIVFLALGLLAIRGNKAFPGWWALLPTLGAFFCIAAGPQAWINRHVLGSRPLVGIGLISYPLYLWHWPLLVFLRIVGGREPPEWQRALALAGAVVLAWATWRYVERHVRHRRGAPAVAWLSGGMVIVALLGVLSATQVLKGRHSDPYFDMTAAAARDWSYPDGLIPVDVYGELLYRIGDGKDKVLLFGDSHVEQYGARAVELARTRPGELQSVYFATWGACPPIANVIDEQNKRCGERRDEVMKFALSNEVDTVVFGGCWNCYFTDQSKAKAGDEVDRYHYVDGGEKRRFLGGGGVEHALRMLEFTMANLAKHKKVYLILDNPLGEAFGPERLVKGNRLGTMRVERMSETAPWPAEQRALHERMRRIAERAGAIVIDPVPSLCTDADHCLRTRPDGSPVYKDAGHLRSGYTREAASFLDPALLTPAR